jgi:hypothetical protein
MTADSNAQAYKLFCADLCSAAKASSEAANYATEAADNAIVSAEAFAEEQKVRSALAADRAATTARDAIVEAEKLAIVNLNAARETADAVAAKLIEAARTLDAKAKLVAAEVLRTAMHVHTTGVQRAAESLEFAIAARNAAVAAAAAAANAVTAAEKFSASSQALFTPTGDRPLD